MHDISFSEALGKAEEKKHLLLGNGFSIAVRPDIFQYQSLYTSAQFSNVPSVEKIFTALGTNDFEAVIRLLVNMAKALSAYDDTADIIQKIERDAEELKLILIDTIAGHHPERPNNITDDQYRSCRQFLNHFSRIYTLNYDLLLYWALMNKNVGYQSLISDDGFRNSEDPAGYVTWQEANSANIHFLHGALHLFDVGHEIIKYTWSKTGIAIVDQIRGALNQEKYPIFVSEGDSNSKMNKILHNAYLHKAYRSFCGISGSIFIYGHSLDSNDDHILNQIVDNTKIKSIFISLYGDPDSEGNRKIKEKAQSLATKRKRKKANKVLEIHFFDAQSAHVWG